MAPFRKDLQADDPRVLLSEPWKLAVLERWLVRTVQRYEEVKLMGRPEGLSVEEWQLLVAQGEACRVIAERLQALKTGP